MHKCLPRRTNCKCPGFAISQDICEELTDELGTQSLSPPICWYSIFSGKIAAEWARIELVLSPQRLITRIGGEIWSRDTCLLKIACFLTISVRWEQWKGDLIWENCFSTRSRGWRICFAHGIWRCRGFLQWDLRRFWRQLWRTRLELGNYIRIITKNNKILQNIWKGENKIKTNFWAPT